MRILPQKMNKHKIPVIIISLLNLSYCFCYYKFLTKTNIYFNNYLLYN